MTPEELAKSVLKGIEVESFNCNVWASAGGACADSWDDTVELDLTGSELRFLLKEQLDDSLFEGLNVKEFDLEAHIDELAEEAAFPEGAYASDIAVEDLDDIIVRLNEAEDEEEAAEIIEEIEEGDYSVTYSMMSSDFIVAGDLYGNIHLTQEEAMAYVMDAVDSEVLDTYFEDAPVYDGDIESDIQDKVGETADFTDGNPYACGGECEELDAYLEARVEQINMILEGKLTEADKDASEAYFREKVYAEDDDFATWWNEQKED